MGSLLSFGLILAPLRSLVQKVWRSGCTSLNAIVSSIIYQGQWRWPRARNRIIKFIINQTPATLHPDSATEDLVVWLPSSNGVYIARSAWEAVRTKFPVQFSLGQKLFGIRLHKWGMAVDEICPSSDREKETHKHLFFECSYSAFLWSTVWSKSSSNRMPYTLGALLNWFVQSVKGDSFKSRIMKSSLPATVYFIWRERNLQAFQQKALARDQVALNTLSSIRDLLSSMRRLRHQKRIEGCVLTGD